MEIDLRNFLWRTVSTPSAACNAAKGRCAYKPVYISSKLCQQRALEHFIHVNRSLQVESRYMVVAEYRELQIPTMAHFIHDNHSFQGKVAYED